MDKNTGRLIGDYTHTKQCIYDRLTTPKGSRVTNRKYGSKFFKLIDKPMNEALKMEYFVAAVEAVDDEKRFKLEKIEIKGKPGKIKIDLFGEYIPGKKTMKVSV